MKWFGCSLIEGGCDADPLWLACAVSVVSVCGSW